MAHAAAAILYEIRASMTAVSARSMTCVAMASCFHFIFMIPGRCVRACRQLQRCVSVRKGVWDPTEDLSADADMPALTTIADCWLLYRSLYQVDVIVGVRQLKSLGCQRVPDSDRWVVTGRIFVTASTHAEERGAKRVDGSYLPCMQDAENQSAGLW